jgi:hypothetical protein
VQWVILFLPVFYLRIGTLYWKSQYYSIWQSHKDTLQPMFEENLKFCSKKRKLWMCLEDYRIISHFMNIFGWWMLLTVVSDRLVFWIWQELFHYPLTSNCLEPFCTDKRKTKKQQNRMLVITFTSKKIQKNVVKVEKITQIKRIWSFTSFQMFSLEKYQFSNLIVVWNEISQQEQYFWENTTFLYFQMKIVWEKKEKEKEKSSWKRRSVTRSRIISKSCSCVINVEYVRTNVSWKSLSVPSTTKIQMNTINNKNKFKW